jgi:hypothetical protein
MLKGQNAKRTKCQKDKMPKGQNAERTKCLKITDIANLT